MSLFRNPVSYSFYLIGGILFLYGLSESTPLVLQHLLIPYSVDTTRGFGAEGARMFRIVVLLAQLLVITSIIMVANTSAKRVRIALSVIGVLLVIMYFFIVTVGYVMPRFH